MDGAFAHRDSPFATLDFQAGAFVAMTLDGGAGNDVVDFVSLPSTERR